MAQPAEGAGGNFLIKYHISIPLQSQNAGITHVIEITNELYHPSWFAQAQQLHLNECVGLSCELQKHRAPARVA